MRTLTLTALALLMLAPMADANGEHATIEVEMHDDLTFSIGGQDDNPDLVLQPGTTYIVNVTNAGSIGHNLNIDLTGGGVPEASSDSQTGGSCCVQGGQSVEFEFTVPTDASGTREYWCDPHRSAGMLGTVTFSGGGDGDNGAPGPGLLALVGLLGAAALLSRR